jgi:diaminopropionate ammonia-lyase
MRLLMNPSAERSPYTAEEARIVSVAKAEQALAEMSRWPGYKVSPLWNMPGLARLTGVGSIACKDESDRFGLRSFKALGGAYAAGLALRRRSVQEKTPQLAGRSLTGQASNPDRSITLCCATDGNHGRSVAVGARRHGCKCVVFVHSGAPESKAEAIRRLGAEVIRTPGNYDDSVRQAKQVAAEQGWLLISDTSDAADDVVAAEVMQGYAIMALEINAQLDRHLPTHVFLQGGVGGLAAAIAGCFAEMNPAGHPIAVVVEPLAAACLMECALRGGPARIEGDLETNMAMLSCGEASAPAWMVLQRRVDAFAAVSDEAAERAASLLCASSDLPDGKVFSPSGAAGLAGFLEVMADRELSTRLGLGPTSRVLIFATEGASDA